MSETEQLDPYLHPPDEMDDDVNNNGLTCFLNMDRPCGPDCMAFTPYDSESKHLPDQAKNCTVLVSVERVGRYLGGVMKLVKDDKADKARQVQVPPPGAPGASQGGPR